MKQSPVQTGGSGPRAADKNDSAPAAATRPASIDRHDTCRLTVAGPAKRADMTIPVTVTVGELLPLLRQHMSAEDDGGQPWVLQRLGGEPFDLAHTPEMLDLRDGEVLYLRPRQHALPALEFDDVAVGIASVVSERPDRWQPAFSRRLLVTLAVLTLAVASIGAAAVLQAARLAIGFGGACVLLGVVCLLAIHRTGDRAASLVTGLFACAFASAAAMSAEDGIAGIVTPGRVEVLLGAVSAGLVAAVLLVGRARPVTPYGAVLMTAAAASIASWLALALHWSAAWAAATLAVAIFMASARSLRGVLRAARLRAPQLPETADELQQDIEPEPEERLTRRAGNAVAYLDSLTIGACVVFVVAFAQLARSPGWAGLTLTTVFSGALLLRSRGLVGLWQRVPLALAAALGLMLALGSYAISSGPVIRGLVLGVFGVAALALLAAARWLPGRKLLPVWEHLASQLEVCTAVALVPLLLEVLHVYSYIRSVS